MISLKSTILFLKLLILRYGTSSNKRSVRLLNFGTVRCGEGPALIRRRRLFQS